GVADALAEIKANRTSRNGDDNHDSGTSSRRTERAACECTYNNFLKCKPFNFKGTEGVKIRSLADRQAKNKRKLDDTSRNNQNRQQPFKRYNVARAYTVGPGEKKVYGGSKPLSPKCNYHHDGQCAPKCTNCKRNSHLAQDYKSQPAAANNQRSPGANQRVVTSFECGSQGHFKRDCPKSFVSTAFSSQIDIVPTALDHDYDVELADGKIIGVNTIIRGCTLNFLNHPFNIDLMPIELGSFDVIIGMDWLVKYHAVIVCDEKIVRIPCWDLQI
ncbi:putative reverse transcriptase domain-containing protein, partial [Tanacetum coccineum]